jgi:uncharacterized protein with gpF-like domain
MRIQAAAAAVGFEEQGAVGAELALKDAEGEWQRLLHGHYSVVGERMAREATQFVAREPKADFGTLLEFWVRTMALRRAKQIAKGTLARLRQIILRGEDLGDPVGTIAGKIRDVLGGPVARVRAATIARTETGIAASWAMQRSVEQLSIAPRVVREWVTFIDARTRPSHVEADGQRRAMNEDFVLREYEGDEPTGRTVALSRPKDPDGPADQVIQCRCVVRYLPPSFEEVLRG